MIRIGIRTQLVVISFSDGVIKVWDYSTGEAGKLLRSVREHDGWVTSFLFWLVKLTLQLIIQVQLVCSSPAH